VVAPTATAAGATAFAGLWAWLRQLRLACDTAGATFAAYCWFASAENQWLRVGGDHLDIAAEVEAFIDSPAWVDLYVVVRRQLVTGHAYGLKVVAGLLGFRWRDEDPGGAQSMQWWERAVAPAGTAEERDAARRRLLAYNEDDVAATAHIRDWLGQRVDGLPSVADAGR
jgi:predicted RecB family nuclease